VALDEEGVEPSAGNSSGRKAIVAMTCFGV